MNLKQLNRILLQTLLVPVAALMFVAAVLALQILKAQTTVVTMQKASENIATAMRVSRLMIDEETAVRGYQFTANEIFLQPYQFAQAPLQDALRDLRAGIVKQGTDPRQVDGFILAHQTWQVAFAEPLISATLNNLDTHDAGLNLRAKAQMDHLRNLIDGLIHQQQAVREQIIQTWRNQIGETLQLLFGLTFISGLIIGVFARERLRQVSTAFQHTLEDQQRTQAALLVSEKLAVTGRLAASLAHEIHNPLDAVINLLYLMRSSSSPEETAAFVDLAAKELDRVSQISRAMLDMSSEAGDFIPAAPPESPHTPRIVPG